MTNHWVDIKNANLIVVMGGNAAEAHPVGSAGRWKPKSITAPSSSLSIRALRVLRRWRFLYPDSFRYRHYLPVGRDPVPAE
jgi:hypothetical protein